MFQEKWQQKHPDKYAPEDAVFDRIHRGDTIFIGSACAEPQYLVQRMIHYVESHPKAFVDAEVLHIRSLGVAPYATEKFKQTFRHNSFFIGDSTRDAVNRGVADYTPIFLSEAPGLFISGLARIDIALVQATPPDEYGFMSLGISVDVVKAAVQQAKVVIVQANRSMPRVLGDAFIHIDDVDYIVPYDEDLLEYSPKAHTETGRRIGHYVSRLIEDGDTLQVGYGKIPNAVLANLSGKKHLGIHTELISDGIVDLMRKGIIDNSRKTLDSGKTVTTFCMGQKSTYKYLHDNPAFEFRTIDYTNSPMNIARQDHMVAINSALEIDLTGQATAESIGLISHSGVGGQADFMRGAVHAKGGKSILAMESTAAGESVSRIVPTLQEGAGVTLTRGDIHYVVTEYGIAYLHGKSLRERAMELIGIAHPKFQLSLIEKAKKLGLIYRDQAFISGIQGEYPEHLESYRTTAKGFSILFRPIKISDEPRLKDFVYSLSDQSLYRRFMSVRKDVPHEVLQNMVIIDYTVEMAILAVVPREEEEEIVGVGRYYMEDAKHSAEVAFAVMDTYHNKGIGSELLSYLTYLAKRQGLLGFTAEVLSDNQPMMHVFEKGGFDLTKSSGAGIWELKMTFR
jgi:acyl-CoA hydrolase/GNAT superfamily N-acetyltransferase